MTKKIALDVATEYTNRGWKVVPVQYRGKGCFESEWQNLRLETGDLPQHFNSSPQNIGVLLGEPSGGLVDIDLDAPEAIALAADFLPPTNAKFGRPSKTDSHWLYKCVPPGTTSKFADIGDINAKHAAAEKKLMLVEYRSTGVQTVFPGSVHEEGEFIDWSEHGEPAPIDGDVLLVCVKKLAAAAILARHWPVEGARQIAALALGGGLARLGWEIEDVKHFLEAVLSVAVDDEAEKRVASVEYTMKKLATDEPATGWPSLANLVGQDVVGKVREWLGVTWPALGSLPNAAKSISPMPPELIPEPLRSWIEDVCAHACIPLELMAVPAMVALSSVVGRTVGISPRCYDDWIVVPNLWGAVIARSGFMKSFAQGEALKPLRRLANVAREQVQDEEVNVSAKRDRIEAEIAALQSGIKAAAKTHSESISDIETQLAEKKKELISLKQTHRRYMTSDATVEKIGEILVENPRGLLQARDELSGWLNSMDKQGRDGDREFYLESWNGDGEFWCDRIGRGTLYIPALTLSIIGGIQPGKLDSYIAECIEGGIGDDGLLQRIQLAVWVENFGDWKKPESWPDTAAKNRAFEVFEFLDNFEPSNAVTDGSGGSIPAFHFTPDAQELFDRWQAELEKLLRSQKLADFPSFESHLAKYRSLMPSLALLFHLLDVASKSISISGGKSTNRPSATFGTDIMGHSGEKLPDEVPLEATELAIAWCKWLRQHAEKTYSSELNPGVEGAHTIVAKIKNGTIKDGQTVRDIYQHHWRGLKTYPQVLKAVLVLIEANWVHIEEQKTGGRPTEIIRLHPELIADQTGKN